MSESESYDPTQLAAHLRTMKGGAKYMEVKWRLVWLREEHPDATVETEMVSFTDEMAVFRAKVVLPSGGSATGWKQETAAHFLDYLEKAETGALGRALAALGFGAQFLPEDGEALADSPVDRSRGQGVTNRPQPSNAAREQMHHETGEITRSNEPMATEKQIKFVHAIAKDKGLSHDDIHDLAVQSYGVGVGELTRRDISALIDKLNGQSTNQVPPTPTPIRQAAPVNDETAWTEFWGWARLNGVSNPSAFTDMTQRSIKDFTPQAARTLLANTLANMPQTAQAGADKWTK